MRLYEQLSFPLRLRLAGAQSSLQLEQPDLSVDSSCISCQTAVCTDNAVTRNNEGDGVMSDSSADCPGRLAGHSFPLCDPGGDLSVGHGLTVGYREENIIDSFTERC